MHLPPSNQALSCHLFFFIRLSINCSPLLAFRSPMEEELCRSSTAGRSDSYLRRIVGRSWSSRLVLESVSSECAAITGYGRLSQSMRAFDEPRRQQDKARLWVVLRQLFSRKDGAVPKLATEAGAGKTKEKKKGRSKWMPDPDRRWPVQGW